MEERLAKTEENVNKLAMTVDKLVYVFDQSQSMYKETRAEDKELMRQLIVKLEQQNDRLSALIPLEKQVTVCEGEIKAIKHSVENLKNAQNAIPLLKEKITDMEKDSLEKFLNINNTLTEHDKTLISLKELKAKGEGVRDTVKVLWALGGAAIAIAGVLAAIFW